MQFTFHGRPHNLPKVRPDKIGDIDPRSLYRAAFSGAHGSHIERGLQKSFLCQAYVRLLDIAGDVVFRGGKRISRKHALDTFKLHPQWDELGLASSTLQRERDGPKPSTQPELAASAKPLLQHTSYLPRDDPAGFPALQTALTCDVSGKVRSYLPQALEIDVRLNAGVALQEAQTLDKPYASIEGRYFGTSAGWNAAGVEEGLLEDVQELIDNVKDGYHTDNTHQSRATTTLKACSSFATSAPRSSTSQVSEASNSSSSAQDHSCIEKSRALGSLQSIDFQRSDPCYGDPALINTNMELRLRNRSNGSAALLDDGESFQPFPDIASNQPRKMTMVGMEHSGGENNLSATQEHGKTMGGAANHKRAFPSSLNSVSSLDYPSFRDRRSGSWSTVDAALMAATLGSVWDAKLMESPLTDQTHSDSSPDCDGFVGFRAMCLSSILRGQAQELNELKKALSKGPAGLSDCVRAVLRLEEHQKSAIREVQMLQRLARNQG